MFVGDNFLTIFDRLSIKSTVTGRTGSLFGVIGTIFFIILCFVIFIGPVIFYFKGDYIQGYFQILKNQNLQLYSGCDFKLAISFYSKDTNQPVDLTNIKEFLKPQVGYYSPSGNYYSVDPLPCSDQYFSEMKPKLNKFKSTDCFIVPNELQFVSQFESGYISVFGFSFSPVCNDPFLCTYSPTANTGATAQQMQFLKNNYYVLRFTATYVDDAGQFKKKFYEIYSTQWESEDSVIPYMWALLQTTKIYIDNSIMPWYNNQTKIFPSWQGLSSGRKLTEDAAQINGVSTFLTTQTIQVVIYRQYKKLDWLLGMLGGGILLLFIIFYVPLNFINTMKQKIQNCKSTVLVRNDQQNIKDSAPPNFSVFWYLASIFPFKLKCFHRQNIMMQESQRLLDIAELAKKLKVATKNLKIHNYLKQFIPSILQADLQRPKTSFSNEQLKYQIDQRLIKSLRDDRRTSQIYQNNLCMLSLYDADGQSQIIKNKMKQIMRTQVYSKDPVLSLQKYTEKSFCKKVCGFIFNFFCQFIKFFDIFGAKINLTGNPESNSGFGCILTLIIIALSVLTFALTLANMGITRTYWDEIYIPAQKQSVKSITGKQFRGALCVSPAAIYQNLVSGADRVVDIKFYQYKRNQNKQTYTYYDTVRLSGDSTSYFDAPNQLYNDINLDNCFRPENGLQIYVYGDQDSSQQAYIGFKLIPRCSGTPATCISKKNQTYQKFYDLINIYPMYYALQQAIYYPQNKKVIYTPKFQYLSEYAVYLDLNYTQPVEQQIYMNTLHMIDHYSSWVMGDFPKPKEQILTLSDKVVRSHMKSIQVSNSSQPYYKLKISMNGNVERIIFSSYKIDFLFATIGGCFIFYYFFFGCFGKAYNHYKMKAKLAQVLYNQATQDLSGFKAFLNWARVLCCKDEVISKIQEDIQCTRLAKNVDSVYRLSTTNFNNVHQKLLGLIYMKQKIRADSQVVLKVQQSSSSDDQADDTFDLDLAITKRLQKKKNNPNSVDIMDENESSHQQQLQKQQNQLRRAMTKQPLQTPNPSLRQNQRCKNLLNNFDLFKNNAQFTLDGKRSVKSVFGGIFCICLFIFICVLTSHFVTIYFSQFHQVSQSRIVDQDSQVRKIRFEVGKNFKFAVSFYKADSYKFYNVSQLVKQVGLSVLKYKQQLLQGHRVKTQIQKIDLQPCKAGYLDGFIDPHDFQENYADFDKAYCVPDGLTLDLYGSPDDPIRQYFSVKIYNKYGFNNTQGIQKVGNLLKNYLPRYHISNPSLDYRAQGSLRYSMDEVLKSFFYQISTSRQYNLTVTKNIIQYDTAINPTNQRPGFSSYQLKSQPYFQFKNSFVQSTDRYNQLNFYAQDLYKVYVIKTIKVNEIFGIIGGCIALLFFGLGCIPRSYNQYKMRYLIGTKLYTIFGRKRQVVIKNKKGKMASQSSSRGSEVSELQYFSQLTLMRAWILSFWGFFKGNYNTNDTMRVATLMEQKVGKDINIFEFMKNLRACQKGVHQMIFGSEDTSINLSRIFPKHIILISNQDNQKIQRELIQQVRQQSPDLQFAWKINNFSCWQIKNIIQAKENNVKIQKVCTQRWLDKYFGGTIRPSTIASRSQLGNNFFQMRSIVYKDQMSSIKQKPKIESTNSYQNLMKQQDQNHQEKVSEMEGIVNQ